MQLDGNQEINITAKREATFEETQQVEDLMDVFEKTGSTEDVVTEKVETQEPVKKEETPAPKPAKETERKTQQEEVKEAQDDLLTEELQKAAELAKVESEVVKEENVEEEEDHAQFAPPGLSSKQLENFVTLRKTNKQIEKELQEKTRRLEQIEKEYEEIKAGKVIPEPINEKLKEYESMKAALDFENSDEYKRNYEEPAKMAEEEFFSYLKGVGFNDADIDAIKAQGGPSKIPLATWDEVVGAKMHQQGKPYEYMRLVSKLEQVNQVAERKQQALEEAKKNPEVYFERVKQRQQEDFKKILDGWAEQAKKIQEMIPEARPLDIPENATPEQRARIEAHNQEFAKLEKRFEQALFSDNPNVRFQMSCAAAHYPVVLKKLDAAYKEIQTLRGLVQKYEKGKQMPRYNQAPAVKASVEDEPEDGYVSHHDTLANIERMLDKAQ